MCIDEMNKNIIELKTKTVELLEKFQDEQQSTSAALGRVANLLEQVLAKQMPAVNEEVIEATSPPKTKLTIKSIVVVKERTE